jgi:hypothetical protein
MVKSCISVILFICSVTAGFAQVATPTTPPKANMPFLAENLPAEFILAIRRGPLTSTADLIKILKIKDENPLRLTRLQNQMIGEIERVEATLEMSSVFLKVPWTPASIYGEYDAANNMFQILVPGTLILNSSHTIVNLKTVISPTFPSPLSFGSMNSNTVCCGSDYISRAGESGQKGYIGMRSSGYQIVRLYMDTSNTAERIYDVDNANNLYVKSECDLSVAENENILNYALVCPLIWMEIGERVGNRVQTIAEIIWTDGKYKMNFY